MFTPPKHTESNFLDVTVLNTPQPQAASTVQRKSIESKYFNNYVEEAVYKQRTMHKNDVTQSSNESSLGILSNISSLLDDMGDVGDIERQSEPERERARQLLQRCSDIKPTSTYAITDTNKENNANIQNLSASGNPSTLINSKQSICSGHSNSQDECTYHGSINKKSDRASVVFEPTEISARSSGLSRKSEKLSSTASSRNLNSITFDSTTAELMAQFGNEEFRPASDMASQMLADELSWRQNYSYVIPATTPEKEYLNLSCFSGIIGELDLSVESGHKVSVDEFFRRKCGNLGDLSDTVNRPSLGFYVNSPKKQSHPVPLVDSTVATEESSIGSYVSKDKIYNIPNMTKEIDDQSIMSLTSIAQALQNIDGTPRGLVDQLIMAKKKKKFAQEEIPVRDTYTLPSNRQSMPATSNMNIDHFDKDIGLLNLSAKLSLDSKIISEPSNVKQSSISKITSFDSNVNADASFKAACEELKKELGTRKSYSQDLKSLLQDPKLSLPDYTAEKKVSSFILKTNEIFNHDKNPVNLEKEEIVKKVNIKEENVSYKEKSETSIQDVSNFQRNQSYINSVVIGKNTEELCNCVVGIARDTTIELLNKSERWVYCKFSVCEIQGDKHNIQLTLPESVILIKPHAEQYAKIVVTVVKMNTPIIAVLNITVLDAVTKSDWSMKHIMCFKPEEIDISILTMSEKKALDFQCVVENSVAVLPVTLKNRNSVDVPLKIFVSQDEPIVFCLENSEESQHVTLKSQEIFTMNICCKGVLRKNTESLQHYGGTLIIQAENNSEHNIMIREIPLLAQVGNCKIQVIDTELPLQISNKQNKPLVIINLGTMSTMVSASFIEDIESIGNSKYFSVQPENLLVQPNETGSFLITYKNQNPNTSKMYTKVKLTTANSVHHYSIIGESSTYIETENENFIRCPSPQCVRSVSSPSSPQSVTSSKSGRNSPLSSVSGATVAGDKLPIKTTHAALVWNSLKTGKSEIKEFTIRNTSNNKIKIQAIISDSEKNFRFLRERQAIGTSILFALQGSESRTISVVFSPHHLGAAAGKIVFRHHEPKKEDTESRLTKVLYLYGYGGYSKVEIFEASKDTSNKMWLSLGTLNSGGSLNAKIKLQNSGDLCSYVKIKLTPKAVYPTMVSSWLVNPTELLLNPKEVQWVTLEFNPRKEDLALLQRSDVSHVGTLSITHGDEPTRWRIRRLYNKMKETGELSGNENEAFKNIVHPICKVFPGEQLTSDINAIRDSVQNLGDLCYGIHQHEIMLTIEVCTDETLCVFQENADESQMFYSLCSDNSHIYEGHGESFLASETFVNNALQSDVSTENFMVSPSTVILSPPTKVEAIVTIKSSCTVAQSFETSLSNTEYLNVVPSEGMIPTRRDFQLKIQCKRKMEQNLNAVLTIYTENNKADVQIRVNVKRL